MGWDEDAGEFILAENTQDVSVAVTGLTYGTVQTLNANIRAHDSIKIGASANEALSVYPASTTTSLGTSNTVVPTQNAVKTYVDASVVTWANITGRPYIVNASNNSATATTTIANVVHATYTAAFFDFVIKNGTNVRAGVVYACHDGTNVEFAETSTVDLGDTSDVTLAVDISGTNMRLRATTTSSTWTIKSLIRAI